MHTRREVQNKMQHLKKRRQETTITTRCEKLEKKKRNEASEQ